MLIPPVSRYMTSNPYRVAPHATLWSASELMRLHKVRRIPVVDHGALVGIVTDRDVLPTYDPGDTVADAMDVHVHAVAAETPVDVVVAAMHAEKIDAVMIIGAHGVEGIFTRSDAMRAFCELIPPGRAAKPVRPATNSLRDRASDTD